MLESIRLAWYLISMALRDLFSGEGVKAIIYRQKQINLWSYIQRYKFGDEVSSWQGILIFMGYIEARHGIFNTLLITSWQSIQSCTNKKLLNQNIPYEIMEFWEMRHAPLATLLPKCHRLRFTLWKGWLMITSEEGAPQKIWEYWYGELTQTVNQILVYAHLRYHSVGRL